MNAALLVNFAFAGTTIDPEPVQRYLLDATLPGLKYALRIGAHPQVIDSLTHAEWVQYNFCQYIAGKQKTLFNTNRQIRDYYTFGPVVAGGVIRLLIIRLRSDFLKNEWYELIPRFEKAVTKIEKLLAQLEERPTT